MIILTATMHPSGSPAGAYEIMHGTITNTSPAGATKFDSYSCHFLTKPKKQLGIVGWEADVGVEGYIRSLGLVPLLGSVLAAIEPVPLPFEPDVTLHSKLMLRDMDEFDARLRGKKS